VGAAAGTDGAFALHLPPSQTGDTVALRVVYIGYRPLDLDLNASSGDSIRVDARLGEDELGLDDVVVSLSAAMDVESITNVQHQGVDEGGIVKLAGDYLVVLRRGRLFTAQVGGGVLEPVAVVDAFAPGIDPGGTWYDELLVVGETVVVIGYSYARGGTEIGLFDLGGDGSLTYRATYHLRSNDYYSSRNYASRVVDGRLVFYTPIGFSFWQSPFEQLPALRRWTGDTEAPFEPIASATTIYRPAREVSPHSAALHTVTSCGVAGGKMDCSAMAVFGPFGHTFYVSPNAVYVWLEEYDGGRHSERAPSTLYRLPLSGGAPQAAGVHGGPVDQFSFAERGDSLLVLVTGGAGGQWMWNAERSRAQPSLLRLPLSALGDGSEDVPPGRYLPLPGPSGRGYVVTNRFVNDALLYGSADWAHRSRSGPIPRLHAVDLSSLRTTTLRLPHAAERIEPMGTGALVVGASHEGALGFSSLRLGQGGARVAARYDIADAQQGESRSHGFFFRSDGDGSGVAGLPIRRWGGRYASLRHGSAAVAFLRVDDLTLQPAGELEAHPERSVDDQCRASCVDWYGNARPLFIGERVFALMGYELVEGRVDRSRVRELRRVDLLAPQTRVQAAR
jgi:hypothetical protein